MNFNKMMFLMMIMVSTMLTISSNNWISMWMGMEMNLMSFIPLIHSKMNHNSQSMMIYFLVQSIGSVILLFSILMNSFLMVSPYTITEEFAKMMMIVGMLIKVGAAPFHSWMPEMMSNMNWLNNIVLMTWQKLAPLFVISNFNFNHWMFYATIILSSTIGAIGGLNYSSLRKIMAYSSINHLSWMFMMMSYNYQWIKYLMLYSLMIVMTCSFFYKYNAYYMNQLVSKTSMMEKITYSTLMLSMGGLPPFLGFLPKWMVIQSMMNSSMIYIMLIMIMMSLITLFYYMRMIMYFMMNYSMMNKWMIMKNNKMYNITMLYINFMLPVFFVFNF
uniref:NADH-ubiquinone oxidoreductase chain 2 n=1 Tax=Meschia woodwardi TaxID=2813447 RepID=A0A8T9ZWP7_9HEMI|nr:NADH dehydrogenase subunit 2 [Meschia woodwardi]